MIQPSSIYFFLSLATYFIPPDYFNWFPSPVSTYNKGHILNFRAWTAWSKDCSELIDMVYRTTLVLRLIGILLHPIRSHWPLFTLAALTQFTYAFWHLSSELVLYPDTDLLVNSFNNIWGSEQSEPNTFQKSPCGSTITPSPKREAPKIKKVNERPAWSTCINCGSCRKKCWSKRRSNLPWSVLEDLEHLPDPGECYIFTSPLQ